MGVSRSRFIPLIVLLAFVAAVTWRLSHPPDTKVLSKMVGKPVPAFTLPPALPAKPGLASADLATGGPRLVNIFASWCVPCVAEAPLLMALRKDGVAIDGIAIRDRPEDIAAFLARHGDPFARLGADRDSRAQMAFGSSGVPETFVVDGRGVIRFHHFGPITDGDVPAIRSALLDAR
jgi:cytochrome c biogenesis protein CcmG/thiol:disulfide interchange protein DsbE